MSSQPETCRECRRPLSSQSGGLVTRFLNVCQCNLSAEGQETSTAEICNACKKPIRSSRPGTMTQYVFGAFQCSCDRPSSAGQEAVEKPTAFKSAAFEGFLDHGEENELQLDGQSFPIERYMPIAELGRGAAGRVYMCRDRLLGKRVAVKTLVELSPDQLIAFQEEARATSQLSHPGIIQVLDFGATIDGAPFMVMEYVPGVSLRQLLDQEGTLDIATSLHIGLQTAAALAVAHNHGIYHRDIKPSNILLYESGESLDVKIIDFGVARVKAATGSMTEYQGKTLAGTPAYMSPDPVLGYSYSARSEVYSIGCVLFEMLTGNPPFSGETALQSIALHVNEPPPALDDMPRDLSELIGSCLAKDPDCRPETMEELAADLSTLQEEEQDPIKTDQQRPRSRPWLVALLLLPVFLSSLLFIRLEGARKPAHRPHKSRRSAAPGAQLFSSSRTENGEYTLFAHSRLKDEDLEQLRHTRLPHSNIVLHSSTITGTGLKYLQSLGVTSLDLSMTKLSGKGYQALSRLKSLAALDLSNSSAQDRDIRPLGALLNLRRIDLSNCAISDSAMDTLAGLPHLEDIYLEQTGVTDAGLKKLAKIQSLRNLVLSNTAVSDAGVESLARNPLLIGLQLNKCPAITGRTVDTIRKRFSRLKALGLSQTHLSSADASKIGDLKNLTTLALYGIPLSTGLLDKLSRRKKLVNLVIGNDSISDKDLPHLYGATRLMALSIVGGRHLTHRGLEKLQKKLKRCMIISNRKHNTMNVETLPGLFMEAASQ